MILRVLFPWKLRFDIKKPGKRLFQGLLTRFL